MYCDSCGHKNKDDARICAGCGKEMTGTETAVDDDYEDFDEDEEIYIGRRTSKTVTVIFSVILVICIGIVAAAGVYFIKSDSLAESTNIADTTKDNSNITTTEERDNYGNVKPDTYNDGDDYYVSEDDLLLRKGPGKDYAYEEILYTGEKVALRGSNDYDDEWCYVYVASKGKYGWVNSNYLSETKPENAEESEYITYNTSFTCYVTADDGLYMREGPSTTSGEITLLEYKKSVEVLGYAKSDEAWYYVRSYINGSYWYGYCHKDYLSR